MMAENRGYIQRCAMLYGAYLGVFWIVGAVFFPLGLTNPFLFLLFIGFVLCGPFIAYRYARTYRNGVCGGSISFSHAWVFTVLMYMFAALLAAAAHYVYFRFIDQGYIVSTYSRLMNDFFESCKNGSLEIVKKYIEKDISSINKLDNEGFSALMLACIFNKINIAEELIKNGADVNFKSDENWTALMFASFYGHYNIADFLLKNNSDTSIKNNQGFDALLIALFYKREDIAKLLIEHKADVNTKNNDGMFPLIYACNYDNSEILKLLLYNGAYINNKNNNGTTALMYASLMLKEYIVAELINNNADITETDNNGDDVYVYLNSNEDEADKLNIIEALLKNRG